MNKELTNDAIALLKKLIATPSFSSQEEVIERHFPLTEKEDNRRSGF